jgi:hypothetical protein
VWEGLSWGHRGDKAAHLTRERDVLIDRLVPDAKMKGSEAVTDVYPHANVLLAIGGDSKP